MHIFVIDLGGDHGTAVFVEKSPDLTCDLGVKPPGAAQETFVQFPDFKRLAVEPVRKAAVSHFSVVEWADPEDDIHLVLSAQFHELSKIFTSGEIEYALLFFVVVPEDICGDDADPAHLHLQDPVLPAALVAPGEVEFPADAEERSGLGLHIAVCKRKGAAVRGGAAEMAAERAAGFLFEIFEIQFIFHEMDSFLTGFAGSR